MMLASSLTLRNAPPAWTWRKLGGHGLGIPNLDVGQHYIHSLGRRALGQGRADPAAGAGNHGRAAIEITHPCSPRRVRAPALGCEEAGRVKEQ